GRSDFGGGRSGGRSDFGRGRGRGRGRGGASAYSDGRGGFPSRGGSGSARGRGRAGRSVGPGYNMDDFELVEEGTGDDGSWDDFGDYSDDPTQYTKPRGADTAYVEDLGTELKVVTRGPGTRFSAAPAADATFSADPNLTPVSGGSVGQGGRSHNRERRAAQRESTRREERDSAKGRGPEGRLWVRDGALLRIKRREEREKAEQEKQAAYFASLGEPGGGEDAARTAVGGGADEGGLDDIFGEYFSPEQKKKENKGTAAVPSPVSSEANNGRDGAKDGDFGGARPQQRRREDARPSSSNSRFEEWEGKVDPGSPAPYGGGGRGRVLDNSIWDADRWESTGSTAWVNAGEGDGGGGGGGGRKSSLPSWKVPKAETEAPKPIKSAPVPDWLPQHGGLGSEARRGVAPLPAGIDTSVKKLGVKGLEAMLKAKFSKMKEGVFTTDDGDVDFYDPDDEGFERSVDGELQLPLLKPLRPFSFSSRLEFHVTSFGAVRYDDPDAPRPKGSGVVARSEAEAAGGGDEMETSPVDSSVSKKGKRRAREEVREDGVVRSPLEVAGPEGLEPPAAEAREEGRGRDGLALEGESEEGERRRDEAAPEVKPSYTPVTIAGMETLEQQGSVSFRDLGISDKGLLANIKKLGIDSPTDVQVAAIDGLLSEEGRDVIIHAHTGSGKTLAYLLPLIAGVDPDSNAVQAVVVAPGRELASQIFSVCERLIKGSGLRSAMIIGGANALRQVERVKKVKPQIVIATPGRLCELVFDRRRMKLGMVRTVVLDEVDALLRPPYDQEIDAIMDATGGRRQAVFASATGRSPVVSAAADRYMREEPVFVGGDEGVGSGQRRGGLPSNIRHTIVTMPKVKKFDTLRRLLNTQPFPESVMIFVNDPIQVNWLTERLETVGIIAAPLSGESSKDDRAEIMRRLQDKRIAMVVTTEMAARGLDVAHLTHVVNYDLPTDADHYVHRAGRCGRAGRPGIVVNLATPDVKFVMGKFSKSLGLPFDDCEIQGGRFWSVSRTGTDAKEAVEGGGAGARSVGVGEDGGLPAVASTASAEGALGEGGGGGGGEGLGQSGVTAIAADGRGSLPLPTPPPPLPRKRPGSSVDRGFLGDDRKEVVATLDEDEDGGPDDDEFSLLDGDGVDDDIMAEAKAFLEGGGAAAAASAAAAAVGAENGASPPLSRAAVEDVGDVFVDAEDEDRALAEAEAFLSGGQKGGDGSVGPLDAGAEEFQSKKGKKAGGDGSGLSSGGVEAFAVPGGLAIVNNPGEQQQQPGEGGGGLQVEGEEMREYDEDDWGDGDWGDDDEEEYDEDDDDDDDEEEEEEELEEKRA
ncbi:unnamed protein product, partial [Scytosiphon promiscuus]